MSYFIRNPSFKFFASVPKSTQYNFCDSVPFFVLDSFKTILHSFKTIQHEERYKSLKLGLHMK
jgi:hypothetical protein